LSFTNIETIRIILQAVLRVYSSSLLTQQNSVLKHIYAAESSLDVASVFDVNANQFASQVLVTFNRLTGSDTDIKQVTF